MKAAEIIICTFPCSRYLYNGSSSDTPQGRGSCTFSWCPACGEGRRSRSCAWLWNAGTLHIYWRTRCLPAASCGRVLETAAAWSTSQQLGTNVCLVLTFRHCCLSLINHYSINLPESGFEQSVCWVYSWQWPWGIRVSDLRQETFHFILIPEGRQYEETHVHKSDDNKYL